MSPVKITDKLSVSAQPRLDEIRHLAEQGFSTLINNRPDGEDALQPGSEAEERASTESGMRYAHLPVTGSSISEQDVRNFQAVIDNSERPVLAHCRSGTRSLTLWVIGEVLDGRMRAEDVAEFGRQHGFDLRGAEVWLAHR